MSSEEYISESPASSHHSETPTTSSGEEISVDHASDGLEADLAQTEEDAGTFLLFFPWLSSTRFRVNK